MPPKPMVRLVAALLVLLFAAAAPAQEGRVRVLVTDAATGDPLVEARVEVVRGGRGLALTDLEGRAELDLESGEYHLRVSADFYRSRRVAVTVARGGPALKLELRADPGTIQEVVVVGQPDTSTEAVQI